MFSAHTGTEVIMKFLKISQNWKDISHQLWLFKTLTKKER